MCTDWGTVMDINWGNMAPEEKERRPNAARVHLRFLVKNASCKSMQDVTISKSILREPNPGVTQRWNASPAKRAVY